MQRDMHYYGTYAMAVAAGIPQEEANVIAYASQFTDDARLSDDVPNKDGGLMYGISTAHSPVQAAVNLPKDYATNLEGQRKIWVPFHFLPGGDGGTFDEKILCVEGSEIAHKMFMNHIKLACSNKGKKAYGLELLGICAHVYMDTYSHYGFSGMSSKKNNVHQPSIKPALNLIKIITGQMAEDSKKGALGHAAVDVCPDLPYLQWQFKFEKTREGGTESVRNNPDSFLKACKKLHGYFAQVAKKCYDPQNVTPFNEIEDAVEKLLCSRGNLGQREKNWRNSVLCAGVQEYKVKTWDSQRNIFKNAEHSEDATSTNIYRFHQAAAYHRYYVLKDLLPAHKIAVY